MKTLETYLVDAEHKGVIDHRLRIQRGRVGEVRFYIHPDGVDGDTLDFEVQGNGLFPVLMPIDGVAVDLIEGPALATKADVEGVKIQVAELGNYLTRTLPDGR